MTKEELHGHIKALIEWFGDRDLYIDDVFVVLLETALHIVRTSDAVMDEIEAEEKGEDRP